MAQRKSANTVIHEDLGWIKDKLSEIDVDLKLLKQTVIGNKEYGQKGLVEQSNEHRKYIESDKNLKAKFVGGTTVVGVIWTLLLKFWDKIF
tara:strand:+ start:2289 stop:2561 length:273 start_codon:yes stop_codon:yes gene_type:complete